MTIFLFVCVFLIDTALRVGDSCSKEEDCSLVPYSQCDVAKGVCLCTEDYPIDGGTLCGQGESGSHSVSGGETSSWSDRDNKPGPILSDHFSMSKRQRTLGKKIKGSETFPSFPSSVPTLYQDTFRLAVPTLD